jgi:hypothetical protein
VHVQTSGQKRTSLAVNWAPPATKMDWQKTATLRSPYFYDGSHIGYVLPLVAHSLTRIGALMSALLLHARALLLLVCVPCYSPAPCCAPALARPAAPPNAHPPRGGLPVPYEILAT